MASLIEKDFNEIIYDEYIDKIISIFKLSVKESSIIFNMKINDSESIIKLSIVNQDGKREEFTDTNFKCDDNFYKNFLDLLVEKFVMNVCVVSKDIVNLDGDSFLTFRLITENNDLFIIDGLSDDNANHLISICCRENID